MYYQLDKDYIGGLILVFIVFIIAVVVNWFFLGGKEKYEWIDNCRKEICGDRLIVQKIQLLDLGFRVVYRST
jgi:hypothetical protein